MAGYGQGLGTGLPNDVDYTDTEVEVAKYLSLHDEIVALVGDHVFDHTECDTGVRKCRQHGAAGYQATCPKAWLRENLPSVFPPVETCPSWECDLPAEDSGEGRWCPSCQDYEGTCNDDHCLTCGALT